MNRRYHFFIIGLLVLLTSAGPILNEFAGFQRPVNFPEPVYDLSKNPVTKDGFELGRKLFYDPRLSRNNTVGCGTCHIQGAAFTHHGHDVSHGIDDRLGSRNSPPIMNLAWSKAFFWDGGVFHLDLQPLVPITTFSEMDERMSIVLEKLRQHPEYPGLYKKAFGSEEINSAKTMKALSQFMLMCVSSNSKYDKVMRKEGEKFTTEEEEGYQLFKQKCSGCHTEPLFTDYSFRNNGIQPEEMMTAGDLLSRLIQVIRINLRCPHFVILKLPLLICTTEGFTGWARYLITTVSECSIHPTSIPSWTKIILMAFH